MAIKVIAYYLPQFHPIPENDTWWGKGFTEWTNVGKAKPLFREHYQPKIPADLGYYDLRLPIIRQQQAEMAREAGVYGFCYWHYWFGNGRQLLNNIIDEVIETRTPDLPFCMGWANESWKSKQWNKDGYGDRVLIEQQYPGENDHVAHFNYMLKAFQDSRYIRIGEKPVFLIYQPQLIPEIHKFIALWNDLAKKNGFTEGLFFIARLTDAKAINDFLSYGFNAITMERMRGAELAYPRVIRKALSIIREKLNIPLVIEYKKAIRYFTNEKLDRKPFFFPSIIPNWDHTARSRSKGLVLHNSTPELFREHIKQIFSIVKEKEEINQVVFLKSWNEWAEGNYMEPDLRFGKRYIQQLNEELSLQEYN